jgi:hypothetical protein
MTTLQEITAQLSDPFAIEDIDLLPKGKLERDGKTLCMALPYADPRAYQDRLNALAPGEWETPAPIALVVGEKLVTYVTIVLCGIAHTDVGEAGPGENQATEAFAQAFKRSASQFGLGRYLYDLEKCWVPYNVQRKQIDLDANGRRNVVRTMYQKAGLSVDRTPAAAETSNGNGRPDTTVSDGLNSAPPSAQQLDSLKKLAVHLGEKIARPKTYAEATKMIIDLEAEYQSMIAKGRAS